MKCDLCDKTFKTAQGVAVHRSIMHKGGVVHNCNGHSTLKEALAAEQIKHPLTAGEVLDFIWSKLNEEDKMTAVGIIFEEKC